jgi:rare lipoprotein A
MRTRSSALFACACLLLASGAAAQERVDQTGQASYYADKFHGRKTANGERLDQGALTAAHPNLPMGSRLEVTNLHNGKRVVVRVNDRGPFTGGRILDLTREAAERLDMLRRGVARVSVRVLGEEPAAAEVAAEENASEPRLDPAETAPD